MTEALRAPVYFGDVDLRKRPASVRTTLIAQVRSLTQPEQVALVSYQLAR